MRGVAALALAALLTACATTAPPPRPPSRIVVKPPPAPAPAPRPAWQPRRVIADGAVVPGGRRHIVKRGETGLGIARAYNVPWPRIVAANNLDAEEPIEIGQAIFIPLPKLSPEEAARNFTLDIDDLVSATTEARRVTPPSRGSATTPAPPPLAGEVSAQRADGGGRSSPSLSAGGGTPAPTFTWPTDARVILSGFGPKPNGRVNDGMNIRVTAGSPVRAAADGTVIYSGNAIAGYGNLLLIRHPGGWTTAYGHLESALVVRGATVRRGDLIARAGSTGTVDEPQLHFQIRTGRRPLNPAPLLR
ncbi:M23 family metallopeptidase [Sandaracinobacteroides saxicola]|uniref:M23 family metallopeptidase n=1 Tax=Sandaracinobacteroides saxicola TaxID=2759707 RepID=A0A7G5IID8_9SPHN|nr:M23 family metallopeptidase [Sandaracinobacteroides saxicola]QMW23130.1 M23 family metallopeptidase [Sandaracinobacteroides saxicola]